MAFLRPKTILLLGENKECYLKCGYEIVREMIYQADDDVDRKGYELQKNIGVEEYQHEHA